jgi:type IV secretory pathway TrbF-like protein
MGTFTDGFLSSLGRAAGDVFGCLISLVLLVAIAAGGIYFACRIWLVPYLEQQDAQYASEVESDAVAEWFDSLPRWSTAGFDPRIENPAASE